ncbi:mannose-6-phosphate isomerase domain protein, partial [Vibrio harveyi]
RRASSRNVDGRTPEWLL